MWEEHLDLFKDIHARNFTKGQPPIWYSNWPPIHETGELSTTLQILSETLCSLWIELCVQTS
jgi:hypothetical protein